MRRVWLVGPVLALALACAEETAPANKAEAVRPATEAAKPAGKEARQAATAVPARAAASRAAGASGAAAAAEDGPKDDYDLSKLTLAQQQYPEFKGKKIGLVFTANVIGEVEPCG